MRFNILLLFISFLLSAQEKPEYVLQPNERILKARSQAYRWGNQYNWILEGDLIIEKGAKLIIDPGTTIKFKPNTDVGSTGKDPNKSELIVRGELIAIGKPFQSQRIVFTSAAEEGKERAGDWYGIIVYKNNKLTRIQNSDIYYGHRGISCFGSSPIIQNSQILYSYNSGIYLTAKSKAQIQSNMINSNSYAGIEVVMRSAPKLSENTIQSNDYGIMIYDSSEPNLGSRSKENSNIGQNNISGNFTYDIYNHSVKEIKAENNNWGSTVIADIRKAIYDKDTHPSYGRVDIQPLSSITQAEIQRQALQSQQAIASVSNNTQNTRTTQRPSRTTSSQPNRSTTTNPTTTSNRVATNTRASSTPSTQKKTTPANTANTSKANTKTVNDTENKQASNASKETENKNNATTSNITSITTPVTTAVKQAEEKKKPEKPANEYTIASRTKPFLQNVLDPGTGLETFKARPEYTGIARAQGIRGRVILKATVGFDGNVESAQIIATDHVSLDKLAIDAALKYKFSKATISKQAVRFDKTLIFKF